ncbi:MAG TPA: carbonic anhydrase family protein [Chitinophagaceae bacterium]|nr:carbonic anhydrase family protein [Chitinophagaceae bacterium]
MRTHGKEFLENLTPTAAYEVLKEGNQRFINNLKINRNLLQQVNETAGGQHPFAVVLSCMDSRTSVELIFDQGLGDIFSIRIAGNVVNEDILGSIEYACKVVGSKLIVVLGHTRCGAIKGACQEVKMGNLTGLLTKVQPAIDRSRSYRDEDDSVYVEKVGYANVLNSMEEILEKSPIINELYQQGQIGIVGGIYSVENGRVHFIKQMLADDAALQTQEQMAV